jgi:magnesium-transporting ATPase (P-type)
METAAGELVMTGEEFRGQVVRSDGSINQPVFNELWPKLRVLSRCSPRDKYVIIQGCQAYRLPDGRRDIVAMTGVHTVIW